MNRHAGVVVLSGLAIAVLVWVIAFRSPAWAAPITEPLFMHGSLLEIALTPGAPAHTPELSVIVLGYLVNFVLTWALMASIVEIITRMIKKGRMSS